MRGFLLFESDRTGFHQPDNFQQPSLLLYRNGFAGQKEVRFATWAFF